MAAGGDPAPVLITVKDDCLNASPLAFTVQFDGPKPAGKQLNIHDRLSTFALKHRRNPSLPEIKASTAKSFDNSDLSRTSSHKFGKHLITLKAGYHSEGYFSSDQDDESVKQRCSRPRTIISPVTEDRGFVPEVNGTENSQPTKSALRRSSMNDLDAKQMLKPTLNSTFTMDDGEDCDKSDTVSEAGTYTIDKDESPKGKKKAAPSLDETITIEDDDEAHGINSRKTLTPENHKWINEWVKKVAEESANQTSKGPPPLSSGSSSSNSASKIPSPVNTMPKIRDPIVTRRSERVTHGKANGLTHHRRSASLSAKDMSETRKSDSSLETESYLLATESVVVAMQSRMRQNLKLNLATAAAASNRNERTAAAASSRNERTAAAASSRNERLHPPSTASDTDTNSETDARTFKKPLNAPFSSARLNRAFSLRRARADIDTENVERKRNSPSPVAQHEKRTTHSPIVPVKAKAQPNSPFARTDVGRYSMRSTVSAPKSLTVPNQGQRRDPKKTGAGARSNSSLSSREMEFQNWKRRKSFDPMKAAAEGRKKEAAKKATLATPAQVGGQSLAMTQSVNLGTTVQPRSGPVLRSASFHTSPHLADLAAADDVDEDDVSDDEEDEAEPAEADYSASYQPVLPPNSPNKTAAALKSVGGGAAAARADSRNSMTSEAHSSPSLVIEPDILAALKSVGGGAAARADSRNSMTSEAHSSPSRRARAEFIDSLLVSAISELSIGLKLRSSDLLKKLDGYCEGDERIARMREDLSCGDSQRGSAGSSPAHAAAHQRASRDFPAILKNLKSLDNVLQLVDEVLFGGTEPDD